MALNNNNDASSLPLRGCVFCCTSIAPESRSSIASTCIEMGGVHKLDLTPHVTHMIVGQTDTPKYKYVARERPDIKVLLPSFIEAVRLDWLEGGDVDLAALESKHAVAPFYGLTVCATGFSELDGRQYIQDTIQNKGGTYSGDLTKTVTHLVASKPEGRKYEYASQWRVKIVSMRWILDSVERGMALDESCFHPSLSYEEQGKGAINLDKMRVPKRPREELEEGKEALGKRKLRRTASSRLTSQNDGLWADIGPARPSVSVDAAAVTTAGGAGGDVDDIRNLKATSVDRKPSDHPAQNPQETNLIFKRPGAETGQRLFIQGFEPRKSSILFNYLSSAGALLLSEDEMLTRFSQRDSSSLAEDSSVDYIDPRDSMPSELSATVVIPHTSSPDQVAKFQGEQYIAPTDLYVTDLWVEKCLHRKALLAHTKPLCEPFKHAFPLLGMQGLIVCPTSFSSVDLLHFSKVVKLAGATYDETLTLGTSVLVVCYTADAGPGFMAHNEKVEYALQNKVPVVSEEWFWSCLDEGKRLSLEGHGLMKERDAKGRLQFYHPMKRPKPVSKALQKQPESKPKPDQKPRPKETESEKTEENEGAVLKDLEPEVNSPPKRKWSPPASTKSNVVTDDSMTAVGEDENQPHDSHPLHADSGDFGPTQRTANLNNAIAELLAQKRGSGNANEASSEMQPQRRKLRPLGRAMSNTSSLGDVASGKAVTGLSRSNSLYNDSSRAPDRAKKQELEHDDGGENDAGAGETTVQLDEEADSLDAELSRSESNHRALFSKSDSLMKREQFRPSQALSYEDPEAAAVREKVMRRVASASAGASGAAAATVPDGANTSTEEAGGAAATRSGRLVDVDGESSPPAKDTIITTVGGGDGGGTKPAAAAAATAVKVAKGVGAAAAAAAAAAAKGVRVASIGIVKDSMGVAYTPGSETFSFKSNSTAAAAAAAATGGANKAGAAAAAGKRRAAANAAARVRNLERI